MEGEIKQIGLVFKDFTKEVENFKTIFGLDKVDIIEGKIRKDIHGEKLENPFKLKFGFTMIGNMQFEFIMPIEGKTIYDEFLEKNGGGIHHLGVYVENFEEKIKEFESKGIKQLSNGNALGIRFAYYDTLDSIGFVTELIEVKTKKSRT